jgi:hypothetical protein
MLLPAATTTDYEVLALLLALRINPIKIYTITQLKKKFGNYMQIEI